MIGVMTRNWKRFVDYVGGFGAFFLLTFCVPWTAYLVHRRAWDVVWIPLMLGLPLARVQRTEDLRRKGFVRRREAARVVADDVRARQPDGQRVVCMTNEEFDAMCAALVLDEHESWPKREA